VGNATGAADLRALSGNISADLKEYLWDTKSGDHFITQLNPDNTTRDFVDYDSNLMALAHGVVGSDDAAKVLARIDGGRCRAGVTFVSEEYVRAKATNEWRRRKRAAERARSKASERRQRKTACF
jgi:hypothetical protein